MTLGNGLSDAYTATLTRLRAHKGLYVDKVCCSVNLPYKKSSLNRYLASIGIDFPRPEENRRKKSHFFCAGFIA